jgi:exopolyphosphatase/guanosine-5'-triphosphate,3'-diphosphate pyrophosphatase
MDVQIICYLEKIFPTKHTALSQAEYTDQETDHANRQLGALDLGSNSFHLLVAQEAHDRVQILDNYKEMVRLAEGLGEDNSLAPKVVKRALECLERFAQRLRSLDPENVRIVGTNTLRKASASGDFLRRAQDILGHRIEIISGHEEARLIYLGVCHDLDGEDTRRLVVDIGGGSTELILGRRTQPETLESLYMGCVSMSQRHFKDGKLTKQNMQRASNHALVELQPIVIEFKKQGWGAAVGASGTINAVSAVIRLLTGDDDITSDGLKAVRQEIISKERLEKLSLPGLADERAAVFPGGVAILSAVFEALNIEHMTAAQSALREGLIFDLLGRKQAQDTRVQTVYSLMTRYRINEIQARQVRETAIGLLSQVAMDWQLTEPAHKALLSWAANLHELGMDISHTGFHKHGAYLIEHMDMPGFSKSEQLQLAALVRAHRRKIFFDAAFGDDTTLLRLTVLLRLAVVLHRNRSYESLPHINVCGNKQTLLLSVPSQWLAEHPLTEVDLANEATYLTAANITLRIEQHD